MNTTILVIVAFSLGLAFGSAFLGTCNSRAYEAQDNASTRFQLLQLDWEQARLKQQQEQLQRSYQRVPCP